MPFKKKSSYRKKPTSWLKKKYSVGEIASKALQGVIKLKQLVNVETKMFDTYNAVTVAAVTGSTLPLSIVLQGDTFANRQGNSIKATSFNYRFRLTTTTANTEQIIRILFYQDRSFSPTATVIGDLIENGAGTPESVVTGMHNHLNEKRFHILSDRVYRLSPRTATNNVQEFQSGYLNIHNHLHYSDTNPNTAINTREGQIYMFMISQDAGTVAMNLYTRLQFVDN